MISLDLPSLEREKIRTLRQQEKSVNMSSGQIRRAKHRALDRKTRSARRKQVSGHHKTQREAAIVRGQLQAAGVLPYSEESARATPEQALKSVTWLVERFGDADEDGRIEVTRPVVMAALISAKAYWENAIGLPESRLDPDYELPVDVAHG